MANFVGHSIGGIITSSIGCCVLMYNKERWNISLEEIMIFPLVSFMFSLFPDIDIKSKPSKFFYSIIIISLVYFYYIKMYSLANVVAIVSLIPQIVSHRGFFHSIYAAILIPALMTYIIPLEINKIVLYMFAIGGYYTHLILDSKFCRIFLK